MYLYCTRCLHATSDELWRLSLYPHGVCPKCGASGYRNAVEWVSIAAANSYPIVPDPEEVYQSHPLLF